MSGSWDEFLRQAARVRPSERQLKWFDREFYGFIHFGVNTFTGREWGTGGEDPGLFNPERLDCDQWVEALKAAGMKGMVLTCKHHDGFCLWPSRTTEHSVKHSPFRGERGDVVREAAEACRRGGIAFGVYLSPWDRNHPLYGTEAYNDVYKEQLTELLTQYGELFHVWFDGACGEGPNGRRQAYDFEGYVDLVRKYQPGATIFNDRGPDVRWIGNESGSPRASEWAVVPSELTGLAQVQTGPGPREGSLDYLYNTQQALGELSTIVYSKGLCFCGSEVDMSIRPGWFYHPEEQPHSLDRLFEAYLTSVGGNACFHLNVPPMPSGRLDERDVERLGQLGQRIREAFSLDLLQGVPVARQAGGGSQAVFDVQLRERSEVAYLVLREDMRSGQRIEGFLVQCPAEAGGHETLCEGTTVGHKRILRINRRVDRLRVVVTSARDRVERLEMEAY